MNCDNNDSGVVLTTAPLAGTHVGSWPTPEPLPETSARHLPPFPLDVFPTTVAKMIAATAAETQTASDLAGCMALGVLAAAGGGTEVRVGGLSEGVNLFIAVPLPAGARKSSVVKKMAGRLLDLDFSLGGVETLADDDPAVDLFLQGARQFVLGDVTPGALAEPLEAAGGIGSIISAEGGPLDMLRRMGGQANLDLFLNGFSNEPIKLRRIGKLPIQIRRPALNIALSPQPRVIREALANQRLVDRGLMDRFLIATPENLVGHRNMRAPETPIVVRDAFDQMVTKIMVRCHVTSPMKLHLTDQAEQKWLEFLDELEPRRAEGASLGGELQAWASKLDGMLIRLAGVLHLAAIADAETVRPIDETAVAGAIRLVDYFIAHARALRGDLPEQLADAKKVLAWITSGDLQDFSQRDCQRALALPNARRATSALAILTDHGWIRPCIEDGPAKPGRPSKRWNTHPALTTEEASAA